MKRILLPILLAFALALQAQERSFLPFVENDKEWYTVEFCPQRISEGVCSSRGADASYYYYFAPEDIGTKEINGKRYQTLEKSPEPWVCFDTDYAEKTEIGHYREEYGRVYRYDATLGKDCMTYDFTLGVNDEFELNPYPEKDTAAWTCKVTEVGTMLIRGNVLKTIRFMATPPSGGAPAENLWIEGIGNPHNVARGVCHPQYAPAELTHTGYMARGLEEGVGEFFPFDVKTSCYQAMPISSVGKEDFTEPLIQLSVEEGKLRVRGQLYDSGSKYKYLECSTNDDRKITLNLHAVGHVWDQGKFYPVDALFDVLKEEGVYKLDYQGESYEVEYKKGGSDTENQYLPMVQEGKTWEIMTFDSYIWNCWQHVTEPTTMRKYWYDEAQGKTINGVKYTTLMLSEDGEIRQKGLFREENGRVYGYDEKTGKEYLKFDITLKEGDEFESQNQFGETVRCQVTSTGQNTQFGRPLKEIRYEVVDDEDYTSENVWIEGVGCYMGPDFSILWDVPGTGGQAIKGVYADGKLLYSEGFAALYFFGWPFVPKVSGVGPLPKNESRLNIYVEDHKLHIKGNIHAKNSCSYLYCAIDKDNVIKVWPEDLHPEDSTETWSIFAIDVVVRHFYDWGTFTYTDVDGEHSFTLDEMGNQIDDKSQSMWQIGCTWDVHDVEEQVDGLTEDVTYRYQLLDAQDGYMALVKNRMVNNMPGSAVLQGYIRNEDDQMIYVRPVLEDGTVGEESLLYDFREMYEYGGTLRYGVMGGEVKEMYIDWHEDSLEYYIQAGEGQRCLPAWQGIVYRYGYLGGPMELFYNQAVPSRTKRPKPSNISHVIFTTKGGKGAKVNGTESGRDVYIPYDSMLEPGKMWECLAVRGNDSKENQIYTIEVAGERMIGGRRCTVLRSPEMGVEKTVFEEGRKLYDVRDDSPELLLDFGLESGDRIDEVKSVLDVSTQDDHRIITIDTGAECEPYEWDKTPWLYSWVEGIGASRDGGFLPDYETSYLLRCWRDGNLIYQTKAYDTVGIRNVETDADATLYDLTGRRTDGNTRSVMIRNGKKYVK